MKQLQDELFCLNYELKTLSSILTTNKLERWLPGFTDPVTDFDHVQRYKWVCDFVKDKHVLDIACGSGKGSYIMASEGKAAKVLGCDIENEAVRYASIKYNVNNLKYEVQDATLLNKEIEFDVIVSFETIEHIPATNIYLDTISKHLTSQGIFIVSTPISAMEEDLNPKNPYHVVEWGFKKFQKIISEKFIIEKIYVQLHDERPYGFFENKLNRFFSKNTDYRNTKIKEFTSEIAVKKLGKQLNGYQILVCSKK